MLTDWLGKFFEQFDSVLLLPAIAHIQNTRRSPLKINHHRHITLAPVEALLIQTHRFELIQNAALFAALDRSLHNLLCGIPVDLQQLAGRFDAPTSLQTL